MSPVPSRLLGEADFVVVERLEALCTNQDMLRSDQATLRSRLSCLEIRMAAVERAIQLNKYARRVMAALAAAATPVLLSVMIDQNLPDQPSPIVDVVRIVSKFLLAFAACVGVPLLLQALADLTEAEGRLQRQEGARWDRPDTPAGDGNPDGQETDGEDRSGGGSESEGYERDGERPEDDGEAAGEIIL